MFVKVCLQQRKCTWCQGYQYRTTLRRTVLAIVRIEENEEAYLSDVSVDECHSTIIHFLSTPGCQVTISKFNFQIEENVIMFCLLSVDVALLFSFLHQYSKGDEALKNKVGEINVPMAVALNNIWLLIWLLLFFWLNLLPEVVPQCAGLAHSMSVFGDNMRVSIAGCWT